MFTNLRNALRAIVPTVPQLHERSVNLALSGMIPSNPDDVCAVPQIRSRLHTVSDAGLCMAAKSQSILETASCASRAAQQRAPTRSVRPLKTIGLISDTHGLLRPEAVRALSGVHHIIHAGDIGNPGILDELRALAPVDAVRGNNDKDAWAAKIPLNLALELEGVSIYVLHDVKELDLDPGAAGFDVVISGHSHKPAVSERGGVQFVNPGSAGPRRFSLPVTIAYLDITTAGAPARARIATIL
jgi:putative phosphoesterase